MGEQNTAQGREKHQPLLLVGFVVGDRSKEGVQNPGSRGSVP